MKQHLAKGGGKLFKWITKDIKEFLTVQLSDLPGFSLNPDALLRDEFDAWCTIWGKGGHDDPEALRAAQNFREFREHVLHTRERIPVFEQQSLDASMRHYPDRSTGIDNWKAIETINIPPVAKDGIAKSIQTQIRLLAAPIQNLVNLHPLLGKPIGRRTVCKTPMLYRSLCRFFDQLDSWDKNNPYPHDTAQTGNSAIFAAAVRNVLAECATVLNQTNASVFNDYEKFFDHLKIPILLTKFHHLTAHCPSGYSSSGVYYRAQTHLPRNIGRL